MSRMMELWMEGRNTTGQVDFLLSEVDGDPIRVIAQLIGRIESCYDREERMENRMEELMLRLARAESRVEELEEIMEGN